MTIESMTGSGFVCPTCEKTTAPGIVNVPLGPEMIREMIRQEIDKDLLLEGRQEEQEQINKSVCQELETLSHRIARVSDACRDLERTRVTQEKVTAWIRGELLACNAGRELHDSLMQTNKHLSACGMNVIQCPCRECQKMRNNYRNKDF